MKCPFCAADLREGFFYCESCRERITVGRCGHANRPGIAFCETCGERVGAVSEPAATSTSACGHPNRAGVRFCETCGERVEAAAQPTAAVAACGHSNRPGVRFCETCGKPVGAPAEVAPLVTATASPSRNWLGIAAAILVIGGGVVYVASASRDGGSTGARGTSAVVVTTAAQTTTSSQSRAPVGGSGQESPATTAARTNTTAPTSSSSSSPSSSAPTTSSGTTSGGVSTTQTPDSGEVYYVDSPIDDWSGGDCPIGHCLTYLSRKWDTTTLSVCLVDAWSVYTLADNRRFIDDAIAFWANGPITLIHTTNCSNADILIDWDRPIDAVTLGQSPAPSSDGSPITIRMFEQDSQRPNGTIVPCDFNPAVNCRRRHSPEVTLAHELGHGLGIGHSEDTRALLYFAHRLTCGATTESNVFRLCTSTATGVNQDDLTALNRLYGDTSNPLSGFEFTRFSFTATAGNERSQTIDLPYPAGSTSRSVLCLVDTWAPNSYSNGWNCAWRWDAASREVHFTVTATSGQIGGQVIVLDSDLVAAEYFPFRLTPNYESVEITVPDDPGTLSLVQFTRYRSDQTPWLENSPTQVGFNALSRSSGSDEIWNIFVGGGASRRELTGDVVVIRPAAGVTGRSVARSYTSPNDCNSERSCLSMAITQSQRALTFTVIQAFMPQQEITWHQDCTACDPYYRVASPRLQTIAETRIEGGSSCSSGSTCVWVHTRVGGGGSGGFVRFIVVYLQL